ncbi:MAG: UvrD-helicase domain-containing protein [Bradymonadaceae bacterium]|nr:UvrD-helicase domain-containing protein [Lujinxingiaceae bacterium]
MTDTHYVAKPAILNEIPLNAHATLEASAGTGKTYTLEHLVVHLLLSKRGLPLQINEILVLTYTRRATEELRERVRKCIESVLVISAERKVAPAPEQAHLYWTIDEAARNHLEETLNCFDDAQIFTIHSFCQHVLMTHAFDNKQLFSGELIGAEELFDRCYFDILRNTYAVKDELLPWLKAWLFFDSRGVDNIRSGLHESHKSPYALWPKVPVDELPELLAQAQTIMASDPDTSDLPKINLARFKTAVLQLFEHAVNDEILRHKRAQGCYTYDDMLTMVSATLAGDDKHGRNLVNALRAQFRFGLIDEFQDTDPVQWQIAQRIFVDSGDQNILYLIGDPKQAIYGFRGADIDTYFGAVKSLAREPIVLNVNYRSSEAMIDAYNHVLADGTKKAVFRQPNDYPNPVKHGGAPGRSLPRLSRADGQRTPAAIEILHLDTEAAKAGVLKLSFAQAIAQAILGILDGKDRLHVERQPKNKRFDCEGNEDLSILPGDIFVLTRSRSEGALIGRVLRHYHIPFAFYRQEGLFQTNEAQDIADLLAAIDASTDRPKRLRAYLTPFFAVPLDDIERYDALENVAHAPRARLATWKSLARRRKYRQLFSSVLQDSGLLRRELLLASGERALTNYQHLFETLTRRAGDSQCQLADLISWFQACIDARESPVGEDDGIQRLESDRGAVQIMTIHKSKGLEADVVFVFGGFNASNSGRRIFVAPAAKNSQQREKVECLNHSAFLEDPKPSPKEVNALSAAYKREEAERLMYVALTRARVRLYLPYYAFKYRPQGGDYAPVLHRLDEVVARARSLDAAQFCITSCQPVLEPHGRARCELEDLDEWSAPAATAAATQVLGLDALRQKPLVMASYSSLRPRHDSHKDGKTGDTDQALLDTEYDENDDDSVFEDDTVEATPRYFSPIRGTNGGSFIHELLEHLDFDALHKAESIDAWRALEPVQRIYASVSTRFGYTAEQLGDEPYSLIYDALTASIALPNSSRFQLAAMTRFAREVRFVFPIAGRAFAHGFVDLLFEHEGKTYFADWKSDHLDDYSLTAVRACVEEKYSTQAAIYTLATVRMLAISDEASYEARFGGFCYFFVRGMGEHPGHGVYFEKVPWDQVFALQSALEQDDQKWDELLRAGFVELAKTNTPSSQTLEVTP